MKNKSFTLSRLCIQLIIARQVVQKIPNDPDNQYLLGYCLMSVNQCEEAEKHFISSLKLDSNRLDSKVSLAYIYLNYEQIEKSISLLQSVLKVNPGNKLAEKYLDRALTIKESGTTIP